MKVKMDQAIWQNSLENIINSKLHKFIKIIENKYQLHFIDYNSFYLWTVNPNSNQIFWQEFLEFSRIILAKPADYILKQSEVFNQNRWFYGAKLNFAQNLLDSLYNQERNSLEPNYIALIALNEQGRCEQYGINDLKQCVFKLANYFKSKGIQPGDKIAGFIPNTAESVIAMLATTAVGAVWSACSPDFGETGACERFSQISPKILMTIDGYTYKNKYFSCIEKNQKIIEALCNKDLIAINIKELAQIYQQDKSCDNSAFDYAVIDYNDPVYIMFSSGTTGKPKCIVHGAGGVLTEHFKEHLLHNDLSFRDKAFYFTSTSWMMWHWHMSVLGVGATIVIYDGAPNYPQDDYLISLIQQYKITAFGASAKYYSSLEKNNLIPKDKYNLDSLRILWSTGSPLLEEQYDYIYTKLKTNVALWSISGGTDLLGCFALGNPYDPIYKGELPGRSLGLAVKFFDEDGQELIDQKGELVCTLPFVSMPIYFLHDPDGKVYHQAYFNKYNYVWAHGDYGRLTSHNGVIIYGRSDAVLNPSGVRIGTAEIYSEVEKIPEVVESLAVGQKFNNDERIVLFVVLHENIKLNDELRSKIKQQIKLGASPRHVPEVIIQIPELPKTASGKLVELAVKNVISGLEVKNKNALANPDALEYFKDLEELK